MRKRRRNAIRANSKPYVTKDMRKGTVKPAKSGQNKEDIMQFNSNKIQTFLKPSNQSTLLEVGTRTQNKNTILFIVSSTRTHLPINRDSKN